MPTPRLVSTGTSKQLHVDGKPFLVRGAEVQNSSFSSARHMSPLWKKLVDMNCNTVLGSVSWEMVEPIEGKFDFSEMDKIIDGARKHNLKLVLLWFGAFKNGISTYAPAWVKMSPERFPRVVVRNKDGTTSVTEILSPAQEELIRADSTAFGAFMKHLKDIDEAHSTVIMVQVENEVGILGDSRDYSKESNKRFESLVPTELVNFIRNEASNLHPDMVATLNRAGKNPSTLVANQSWGVTFGEGVHADEIFTAYDYARYVNAVAAAGKAEYDLPMFANFWLNFGSKDVAEHYPVVAGGGDMPGNYPSGGAVSNVLDIWMKFAPHLDFLSPDTYLNDYHRICQTYRHRNQPLFIPEQRRDEYGARRVWGAMGMYQAIGACPFGLDTLEPDNCAFTKHYDLLAQVSDVILTAQQSPGSMIGFFYDEEDNIGPQPPEVTRTQMGAYEVTTEKAFTTGRPGPGYGVVISLGAGDNGTARFLLVGAGFQAKFRCIEQGVYYTGILDFEEKIRENDGTFTTIRRLNGDETRSGQQAIMPNEEPDTGGFPIHINIPAVTKIAECTVYSLKK